MKDIFILDTYFNLNHLVMRSLVLQAYKEKGLEEPIIGGYDDFNKGADFCGIDRFKDFIRNCNNDQRIVFYLINEKNAKNLMEFKSNLKLDNFIIIHTNTIINNQYSKIGQYKFLEKHGYSKYLPLIMYLNDDFMIKEGINSGTRGNIYCNSEMMLLKRIDGIKTHVVHIYAKEGKIIHKCYGYLEDIYYHSGTKFLVQDKFDKRIEKLVFDMIKDFNLSGICEFEFLEDKKNNLWYLETNMRASLYASDYLRNGVLDFIKDFI